MIAFGEGWIADPLVPLRDRQLAGDHRRERSVPIFEDLEEIVTLLLLEAADAEVVKNEDVAAGRSAQGPLRTFPRLFASPSSSNNRGTRRYITR